MANLSDRAFAICCFVFVLLGFGVMYGLSFKPHSKQVAVSGVRQKMRARAKNTQREKTKPPINASKPILRPDEFSKRVKAESSDTTSEFPFSNVRPKPSFAGNAPYLKPDQHPDVRKVIADMVEEDKPAAYNPFAETTSFDSTQYRQNPSDYLDSVEPGRVFDTLDPGEGVPALKRLSAGFTRVLQGESVLLRAKTAPGSPVSFTSRHLGEFPNKLTAITVAADEEGIAKVEFKAASGTQGEVDILAASPVASGQIHFFLHVDVPD